jgi:hypothetical protein
MISGLVLTLRATASDALGSLRRDAASLGLELGEPAGRSVPAVLESAGALDGEERVRALFERPEIELVDVVYVAFDGDQSEGANAS